MSTNSDIAVQMHDGTEKIIYCHWNGYISHNGNILNQYYNTQEKVEALIELGDLSVLAPSTECPPGHTFITPMKGCCVAYGRDRGEKNRKARTCGDVRIRRAQQEYMYYWIKSEKKWYVKKEGQREGVELSDMCKMYVAS